jgi:DNA adenine methylase
MSNIKKKSVSDITPKRYLKSPLNYIGGKYKLLPQLFEFFPRNISNFVDLFAGGFNVGINIDAKKVYLNDNLTHLIDMYEHFNKHDRDHIISHIHNRISSFDLSKTNTDGYISLREEYNSIKNPLDLFVLTAYSFNHQIRFNNNHQFNNPFGRDRSSYNKKMEENLLLFLDELHSKEISISSVCFEDFDFSFLSKNDYVYCDPPYLITTGSYNDGKRGFKGWGETEEIALLEKLDELHRNGVGFGLSNVTEHKGRENKLLKNWIKKNKEYRVHDISSNYKNSSYKNAGAIAQKSVEVFITNV